MWFILDIFLITGVESVHAGLRRSDETHGCHITQEVGSDIHVKKSKNSLCYWNAKILPNLTSSSIRTDTDNGPSDNPPENLNVSADFSTTVTAPDVNDNHISDTRSEVPDCHDFRTSTPSPHSPQPRPSLPDLSDPLPDPNPPPVKSQTISLSEHLDQNGMEIRKDILRTETGNCW